MGGETLNRLHHLTVNKYVAVTCTEFGKRIVLDKTTQLCTVQYIQYVKSRLKTTLLALKNPERVAGFRENIDSAAKPLGSQTYQLGAFKHQKIKCRTRA